MKLINLRGLIILLVLSFAPTKISYGSASLPNDKIGKLYLVRRIFIAEIPGLNETRKVEIFLKTELLKWGFLIAEDRVGADAILTGVIEAEVILDGDGSIPNKAVYKYELRLTNNELVWKGKVKFPTRRTVVEANQYAAQQLAEKIAADWKKSAKKGAGK
jgi:hypothetical protein